MSIIGTHITAARKHRVNYGTHEQGKCFIESSFVQGSL
jgi:hypothetical protein